MKTFMSTLIKLENLNEKSLKKNTATLWQTKDHNRTAFSVADDVCGKTQQ